MTDWPAKLGPMPEAVREYETADTLVSQFEVSYIDEAKADAVIAELTRKLLASIEWGRIEQKRKEKAEVEVARLTWMLDELCGLYIERHEYAHWMGESDIVADLATRYEEREK